MENRFQLDGPCWKGTQGLLHCRSLDKPLNLSEPVCGVVGMYKKAIHLPRRIVGGQNGVVGTKVTLIQN